MSNFDIKKLIIENTNKDVKLDGKSEIYIDAAYETLMQIRQKQVNVSNVSFSDVKADSSESDLARQKMIDNHKNAHLAKKGK